MNWGCDVYVYEDCMGGWTTHVAGRRRVFPPIPEIPLRWMPSFGGIWSRPDRRVVYPTRWQALVARIFFSITARWHSLCAWSVRVIPLRPIGLPHDGESFNDSSAAECADRLEWLREMGYSVPQYAIDALRSESESELAA